MRFAAGRAFHLRRGRWVDSRWRRGQRTVRVRWGSPAYFRLLRERPRLRRALALGREVTVVVGEGRAVIVSQRGDEGVSVEALVRFLGD